MKSDKLLVEYLPDVLVDVREYRALTVSEQPEINKLWEGLQEAIDNQYITTSTEYGISRREKMLNITPKGTATPEDRIFAILTRLAEQLPYSYRMLGRMLAELCGKGNIFIELETEAHTLRIKTILKPNIKLNDIAAMVKRICPANMVIALTCISGSKGNIYAFGYSSFSQSLIVYPEKTDMQNRGGIYVAAGGAVRQKLTVGRVGGGS